MLEEGKKDSVWDCDGKAVGVRVEVSEIVAVQETDAVHDDVDAADRVRVYDTVSERLKDCEGDIDAVRLGSPQ